jgi:hypothetical protein
MTRASVGTYLAMLLLIAATAGADTVRLRTGESLEGTVSAESYTIRSQGRGDLVIPVASIAAIRVSADGWAVVELVDGSELEGSLVAEAIELDQGLFSRSLKVRDVAEVEIAARREPMTVPKDTPVKLMLAEWLHSRSVQPGQAVHFCVAEDVLIGQEVAFAKGTPATGEVTEGRAAGRVSQQGEIAIEPRLLLAPDGSSVPVGGASGEFKGGLDPGAFVMGGVLGFLASGEEVKVPPGVIFEAMTRTEKTLAGSSEPSEEVNAAWRRCERFFRFTEAEVVPIEEVDLHEPYAPLGTALNVSLPLSELADLEEGKPLDRSFRSLIAYDTFLQTVSLSVDRGRKNVKLPVRLFVTVLPSHDKYVDLKLSLVDGEDVLAEEETRNIDAEEEKSRQVQMTLTAEPARFDQALATGELRLRIRMEVRE